MPKGAVGQWLERQFLSWQNGIGEKQTVAAFADYIGIKRDMYNKYVNGTRKPSGGNLQKIAAKLDPEIYDLLGKPRPDPLFEFLSANWGLLPDDVRQEISETVARAEVRGIIRDGSKRVEVSGRRRTHSN